MQTRRKYLFLEPFLVEKIDYFINNYVSGTRGRIINIVVSLFLLIDENVRKKYENLANEYIEKSPHLDYGVKYGEVRKGKVSIQLYISSTLEKEFNKYNNKVLVVAALLYVGILKGGE
ncbi:hypothetical protein U271_01826 [Staphylococcus aureus F70893]|uniref:hypothetical protein n=1 Tax=Staphylococcus aureus TaxID=1280 RepID=UPI00044956E2|nr:hypothetical protein [Staphylococcus aureus]EVX44264.1 hypothetical protein U271_01826 [Staphylococcus aureus F70893]EVX61874.1 hypothetical protein U280_02592 [Staphylococcus aureus F77047]EWW99049.1 hypothetical protein V308_01970 [Staphylococcus aureus H81433]